MNVTGLKGIAAAAAAGFVIFLFVLSGVCVAQGFSDFSKLLGGGSSGHSRNSSQAAVVTVERGSAPYTGTFTGKQTTSGGSDNLSTRFVCYSAHDPAFAQTKAFVCYAAE